MKEYFENEEPSSLYKFSYSESLLAASLTVKKLEQSKLFPAAKDVTYGDIERKSIQFIDQKKSEAKSLIESFTGDKISDPGSKADFISDYINQSLPNNFLKQEAQSTLYLSGTTLVQDDNGKLSEINLSEATFSPSINEATITCYKNQDGEIEFKVKFEVMAVVINNKNFYLNNEGILQDEVSEPVPLCTYSSKLKLAGSQGNYHLQVLDISLHTNCSNIHSILDREDIPEYGGDLKYWVPIKILSNANLSDINDLTRSITLLNMFSNEEWGALNDYSVQDSQFRAKLATLLVKSHILGVIDDPEQKALEAILTRFLPASTISSRTIQTLTKNAYKIKDDTINNLASLLTKLRNNEFFVLEELIATIKQLTSIDPVNSTAICKYALTEVEKKLPLSLTQKDYRKIHLLSGLTKDKSIDKLKQAFSELDDSNNLEQTAALSTEESEYITDLSNPKVQKVMKLAEQYNSLRNEDENKKKPIAYHMTEILLADEGEKLANAVKQTSPQLYKEISVISRRLYDTALKNPQEQYLAELIEQLEKACTPGYLWTSNALTKQSFRDAKELLLDDAKNLKDNLALELAKPAPNPKFLKIEDYYNNSLYCSMGASNYDRIKGIIFQINMIHYPLAYVKKLENQATNQDDEFLTVKAKIHETVRNLEKETITPGGTKVKVIDGIKETGKKSRIVTDVVTGFMKIVSIIASLGIMAGFYAAKMLNSRDIKGTLGVVSEHKVGEGLTLFRHKRKQMGDIKVDADESSSKPSTGPKNQ